MAARYYHEGRSMTDHEIHVQHPVTMGPDPKPNLATSECYIQAQLNS